MKLSLFLRLEDHVVRLVAAAALFPEITLSNVTSDGTHEDECPPVYQERPEPDGGDDDDGDLDYDHDHRVLFVRHLCYSLEWWQVVGNDDDGRKHRPLQPPLQKP